MKDFLKMLSILSTLIFSSCIFDKGTTVIDFGGKADPKGALESGLTDAKVISVSVVNDQLVISGSSLQGIQNVKITDNGSFTKTFSIDSQTSSQIIANGIDAIAIGVGEIFNLVIGNAYGQAVFPVTFTLQDNAVTSSKILDGEVMTADIANGAVTPAKLSTAGASAGSVLQFDGTNWNLINLNGLTYQGTWNANTNTPSFGAVNCDNHNPGDYYAVSVSGSTLVDGESSWASGDWIICSNNVWDKVINTTNITSVFGRTGAVTAGLKDMDDVDSTLTSVDGQLLIYRTANSRYETANFIDFDWVTGNATFSGDLTVAGAGLTVGGTAVCLADGTNCTYPIPTSVVNSSSSAVVNASSGLDAVELQVGGVTGAQLNAGGTFVVNNFQVSGGTPGAGKVLMSDVSGNGTWQDMAISNVTSLQTTLDAKVAKTDVPACTDATKQLVWDGTTWACLTFTDTNTNAGTICTTGEYLDGDGTCKSVAAGGADNSQAVNVQLNADNDSNSTGEIQFLTGATQQMVIDNSGKVGIGVLAPVAKFHVQDGAAVIKGTSGTLTVKKGFGTPNTLSSESVASFDNEGTGGVAINMFSSNAKDASIYFGQTTPTQQGYIRYHVNGVTPANQKMSFAVNGSQRMMIDASGNIVFGASALVPLAGTLVTVGGTMKVTSGSDICIDGGACLSTVDTNTTYTGGDGLTLTGTDFAVNVDGSTLETNLDTLRVKDAGITDAKIVGVGVQKVTSSAGNYLTYAPNGVACALNEVLKLDASGQWICAVDNDTTYTGGDGLALTGTDFTVNVDGSTLETNLDTLRVKDGGITDAKVVGVGVQKIISSAGNYLDYKPNNVACAADQIMRLDSSGNWVCANADIDASGNLSANNVKNIYLTRTLPVVVNDVIEIGKFTLSSSAHNLDIAITVSDSGFSLSKRYQIPSKFCNSNCSSLTWYNVLPQQDTGIYSGNDFDLDIMQDNTTHELSLRLRRTAGVTAGTGRIYISQLGDNTDTFTSMTAIASVVAPANHYYSNSLTSNQGKIGIGKRDPATALDVDGTITATAFVGDGSGITGISAESSDNIGNVVISADSDSNTSGEIQFNTAGTTKAVIDNSGKMGIGQTVPTAQLHVTQASGGVATAIFDLVDNTANNFVLKQGTNEYFNVNTTNGVESITLGNMTTNPDISLMGNVGIGVNPPTTKLHVKNGEINIQGTEVLENRMTFRASDNSQRFRVMTDLDSSTGNDLLIFRSNNMDNQFVMKGNGYNGMGAGNPETALHISHASLSQTLTAITPADLNNLGILVEDSSLDNVAGEITTGIAFGYQNEVANAIVAVDEGGSGASGLGFVTGNNTTVSEAMRITSAGRVSLGSGSTTYGLDVRNQKTTNTGTMYIGASLNGSGKGLVIDSTTRSIADNTTPALEIINRAGTNTMTATVEGKVGIGTSVPSEKLHVVGALNPKIRLEDTGNTSYLDLYQGTNSYITAKNALYFGVNAIDANAVSVLSTGNVGIGTTGPSAKLQIHQTAAAPNLLLSAGSRDIATPDGEIIQFGHWNSGTSTYTERMQVSTTGNVGIGTTTPSATLDVNGSMKVNGRSIASFSNSSGVYLGDHDWSSMISAGSATYSTAEKGMVLSGGGTFIIGTRLPVDAYATYRAKVTMKKIDGTGNIYVGADSLDGGFNSVQTDLASSYNYFAANGDTLAAGSEKTYVGFISGYNTTAEGNPNKFDPGAQYFNLILIANYTGSGNTVVKSVTIERVDGVYVDEAGNVGIGTVNPTSQLHIGTEDTGTVEAEIKISGLGTGQIEGGQLALSTSADYDTTVDAWMLDAYEDRFRIHAGGSEKMTVLPSGNVGIGTASPAEKLHVAGNIYANMGEGFRLKGDTNYFGANLDAIVFEMVDGNNTAGNTDGGFVFGGYTPTDTTFKEWMVVKTGGNVGIGRTSPIRPLDVNGGAHFNYTGSGATVHVGGSLAATGWVGAGCEVGCDTTGGYSIMYPTSVAVSTFGWTTTSDERLKEEVTTVENVLEKIEKVRAVEYFWKDREISNRKEIGVIAQEIQAVFPELVHETDNDFLTVDYPRLGAIALEGIKALNSQMKKNLEMFSIMQGTLRVHEERISANERAIASLKEENESLRKMVEELKKRLDNL